MAEDMGHPKVATRVVMARKTEVRISLASRYVRKSHDALTKGWFGGGRPPQQQQPQVVYQQAQQPPKKSGMGIGTAIAAGMHGRDFFVPSSFSCLDV